MFTKFVEFESILVWIIYSFSLLYFQNTLIIINFKIYKKLFLKYQNIVFLMFSREQHKTRQRNHTWSISTTFLLIVFQNKFNDVIEYLSVH